MDRSLGERHLELLKVDTSPHFSTSHQCNFVKQEHKPNVVFGGTTILNHTAPSSSDIEGHPMNAPVKGAKDFSKHNQKRLKV